MTSEPEVGVVFGRPVVGKTTLSYICLPFHSPTQASQLTWTSSNYWFRCHYPLITYLSKKTCFVDVKMKSEDQCWWGFSQDSTRVNQFQIYVSNLLWIRIFTTFWQLRTRFLSVKILVVYSLICFFLSKIFWLVEEFVKIQDSWFYIWFFDLV